MQNKRGSIFKPFAALKGYDEAIKEKEEVKVAKPSLSSDKLEEMQEVFNSINKGSEISLSYYHNYKIYTVEAKVIKIDNIYKKILVSTLDNDERLNVEISNIVDIKLL